MGLGIPLSCSVDEEAVSSTGMDRVHVARDEVRGTLSTDGRTNAEASPTPAWQRRKTRLGSKGGKIMPAS